MARELAKAITCTNSQPEPCDECHLCRQVDHLTHPDVRLVVPGMISVREGRRTGVTYAGGWEEETVGGSRNPAISINVIRDLREEISKKPFSSPKRVVVIREAHLMTTEASNALLKVLEEPPSTTHIVLTTSRPDLLLPTIRSRCQWVPFHRLTRDQVAEALISRAGVEESRARLVAALAQGSLGRGLRLVEEGFDAKRKEVAELFLRLPHVREELGEQVRVWGRVETIGTLLLLLSTLYQDLLLLKWGGSVSLVRNQDLLPQLSERSKGIELDELVHAVEALDDAGAALRANVDPRLVLLTVLSQLP